jgi:hypothetical protein
MMDPAAYSDPSDRWDRALTASVSAPIRISLADDGRAMTLDEFR